MASYQGNDNQSTWIREDKKKNVIENIPPPPKSKIHVKLEAYHSNSTCKTLNGECQYCNKYNEKKKKNAVLAPPPK